MKIEYIPPPEPSYPPAVAELVKHLQARLDREYALYVARIERLSDAGHHREASRLRNKAHSALDPLVRQLAGLRARYEEQPKFLLRPS